MDCQFVAIDFFEIFTRMFEKIFVCVWMILIFGYRVFIDLGLTTILNDLFTQITQLPNEHTFNYPQINT